MFDVLMSFLTKPSVFIAATVFSEHFVTTADQSVVAISLVDG